MRILNRLLVIAVGVFFALVLAITLYLRSYLGGPLQGMTEPVIFEVPVGASLSRVARELTEEGLITRPEVFVAWGRFTGQAAAIKAGEYELLPELTVRGLLDQLVAGDVKLYPVTILEGWTIRELRQALAGNGALEQTLAGQSDAELLAAAGIDARHPEGLFFPETYLVARGTLDVEILRQASQLMETNLAKAWESRATGLPLKDPYELLTLASIIERETALDAERPQVAGVFIRRLQKRMRLQTDPTVIYGLGDEFDGNLTRKHLLTDNPYNTYTRGGLPPTPIGMPGAASLQAAGHPAAGDTLYFVATGEPDGSHVFSRTLAEHNAAVAAYIAKLRQQRRDGKR